MGVVGTGADMHSVDMGVVGVVKADVGKAGVGTGVGM